MMAGEKKTKQFIVFEGFLFGKLADVARHFLLNHWRFWNAAGVRFL